MSCTEGRFQESTTHGEVSGNVNSLNNISKVFKTREEAKEDSLLFLGRTEQQP
jgi:hypothetical protein